VKTKTLVAEIANLTKSQKMYMFGNKVSTRS